MKKILIFSIVAFASCSKSDTNRTYQCYNKFEVDTTNPNNGKWAYFALYEYDTSVVATSETIAENYISLPYPNALLNYRDSLRAKYPSSKYMVWDSGLVCH